MILASSSLLLFIPIGILARPHWQDLKDTSLHIKEHPNMIMIKTLYQIVLITINRILKEDYEEIHGFIFTLITFIYAILFFKIWPYNYDRTNVIVTGLNICVSCIGFFSTIAIIADGKLYLLWISLTSIFLLSIGAFTIYKMKKFPEFIKREQIDTTTLFRFAFRLNSKIEMLKEHIEARIQRVKIQNDIISKNASHLNSPEKKDLRRQSVNSQLSKFLASEKSVDKTMETQKQSDLHGEENFTTSLQNFQKVNLDKTEEMESSLVFKAKENELEIKDLE